jgi:transcription elongation GreA/GreB family factor
MGTVVTLKPVKGGQDLTYTILGAWDSDPEKAIISYMSVTAKELIGSKVGDTVRIMPLSAERKQAFVISAIAPYAE